MSESEKRYTGIDFGFGKDNTVIACFRKNDDGSMTAVPPTSQEIVIAIRPSARVWYGRFGAVCIEDDKGRQLSIICAMGSHKEREGDAWDDAAQRLERALRS